MKRCALPVIRLYWRVARPRTFGVKAIVTSAARPREILVVRHSYGDRSTWNLPGGGFNPRNEDADAAMRRELQEELACEPAFLNVIGSYFSCAEGKRDTVTIFRALVCEFVSSLGPEIEETRWIALDELALVRSSQLTRFAADLYSQSESIATVEATPEVIADS